MRLGVVEAAVLATVAVVVCGAAILAFGQGYPRAPTSYGVVGTFNQDAAVGTPADPSRTVTFTITFITTQPWMGEDLYPYTLTVDVTHGSNVGTVELGDANPQLTRHPYVSDAPVIYATPIMKQTTPDHWTISSPDPHLLYAPGDGSALYVRFDLTMVIYYADGTSFSGGWRSPFASNAILIAPDYVLVGQALLYTGGSLGAAACVAAAVFRWTVNHPTLR